MAIFISDEVDFRTRKNIRDKGKYYIMIRESVLQEDIIILNVCAPNKRASKYVMPELKELKGEIQYMELALCMEFFLVFFWLTRYEQMNYF